MLIRLATPHRALLAPLSSTRSELVATKPHHDATIAKADRILEDWRRFDGALRIVIGKKP